MLQFWTSQQVSGVANIEEPECITPVLHGVQLTKASLLAVAQARLTLSDPDAVLTMLIEAMHLAYWCLRQGAAANCTLIVCISICPAVGPAARSSQFCH